MCYSKIINATALLACAIVSSPGATQIEPDATLPVNSAITQNGTTITITGGTQSGGNLFHSFEEFSLPEGGDAFFNNPVDIQNILTRVTGGNISNIDGVIRANGNANLLILNPNGIIFGPNARLDIGGSFFATTADSLQFADGSTYSAINPSNGGLPLLTVSVPMGLQFGQNPGRISQQSSGLQLSTGQTLAILGGEITIPGGTIAVPGGAIEIAAIGGDGSVTISPTNGGYSFAYEGVTNWRSVELSNFALIDGSGDPSSSIAIHAGVVQILSGARVYAENTGAQTGGNIRINGHSGINLQGTGNYSRDILLIVDTDFRNPSQLPTGVYALTSGSGAGGSLTINTPQINVQSSSFIETATNAAGRGGDITVNATESTNISAAVVEARTTLNSTGDGGNFTLSTNRLMVSEVGLLSVGTNGAGRGGILTIDAGESVELVGTNLLFAGLRSDGLPVILNTALFAATGGDGDAGELRLFTQRLVLRDGAAIVPNSTGAGRPGNTSIVATESVTLVGKSPPGQFQNPSGILAGAGNNAAPGGGNIRIVTEEFMLNDGAIISARRSSPGTGGNITIDSRSIRFDQGNIAAETAFGQGGNIILNARDIELRNGSSISVTAGLSADQLQLSEQLESFFAATQVGAGNGGNITIATENLITLENSDIIANAQEGFGGRVSIDARGIFGSGFRDSQTPQSDITASSALGAEFRGVVQINQLNGDPTSGLIELPAKVVDAAALVVARCVADDDSSFTVTGRGGLPPIPQGIIRGETLWRDWQDYSSVETESENRSGSGSQSSIAPRTRARWLSELDQGLEIVEAIGWVVDGDGNVDLVAAADRGKGTFLSGGDNCYANN